MSGNHDYEIDPFYDIQQTLLQEQEALEEQQEASPRHLLPSKPTERRRGTFNPLIKAGSSGRTRTARRVRTRKVKTRTRRNKKSRSRK